MDDLVIVIENGVVIDTTGGLNPGVSFVSAADFDITVSGGTSTSITTDAQSAFGVFGATTSGALNLTLDEISTSGANASGILAISESGTVTVSANEISNAGAAADGINIQTASGTINVNVDDVSVTGANSTAISALSDTGNVRVTSTGSVVADGRNAGRIVATSGTGDVAVTTNKVSTVAVLAVDEATDRAAILATGANASMQVNGTATTSATGFPGPNSATVAAIATNGNADATVNNILASGFGVEAVRVAATNNATATINGQVTATGENADGIIVNGGNTPLSRWAPMALLQL